MTEYFDALKTAITNGAGVVVVMLVVSAILTLISGGPAARNWRKDDAHH